MSKFIIILATNGFMSLSEIIIFFSQILLLADMKTPVHETLEFDQTDEDKRLEQQLIHQERGSSSLSAFLAKQQKQNRFAKEKMTRVSMWSPYQNKS